MTTETEHVIAQFGVGKIGSIAANDWQRVGELRFLVDSNEPYAREKMAKQGLETELIVKDFEAGAGKLDADIETSPLDELGFRKQWGKDYGEDWSRLIRETGLWSISVNTPSHEFYFTKALQLGKRVFLEKPSTERPGISRELLERYPDALVQVDYIERGHPVTLTIGDHMREAGVVASGFYHWRGKDLRGTGTRRT